jgi:predicted DCC family thiol-disulfide oxidoreductase YuxK
MMRLPFAKRLVGVASRREEKARYAIDCEQGMMLIDANNLSQRWQGSEAAEAIGKLLPGVSFGIDFYRWIPGLKWLGDRGYIQIRDNRYNCFGKRDKTYISPYQFKSCDRQ